MTSHEPTGTNRPMVTLVLDVRAQPGRLAELYRFLAEAKAYYEEPGGIRMRLYQDQNDRERLREVFEYATFEAFEFDNERTRSDPTMRALLAQWRELLVGPPDISVWSEIDLDQPRRIDAPSDPRP